MASPLNISIIFFRKVHMSQRLDPFLGQSPRYVLLPEEGRVIRFAGPQHLPWEEDTKIQNISVKGLHFFDPSIFLNPIKGKRLKLSSNFLKFEKIACYGRVVEVSRTDGSENSSVEIEFIDLNSKQKIALKESLGYIVNKENIHDREFRFWKALNAKKIVGLILLLSIVHGNGFKSLVHNDTTLKSS